MKNIIIGAGLAGLSAAYHLGDDYLLLEKEDRVGGLCRTEFADGFGFDYAVHVLYSNDPYATHLIQNELLKDNLVVQPRSSWIFSKETYTRYPFQANMYGLPIQTVKECLLGVINATYENKYLDPKNFEQWIFKTFGGGISKHFMIPYNKKQWATELTKMTDEWIKDRVMTPTLDEVIEGALIDQKKKFGPNAVFWYPKEGGIEALPKGFLRYVDEKKLLLNTSVLRIMWKDNHLYVENGVKYRYKKLISTLPLPHLINLLKPPIPSDLRRVAGRLTYNTTYAVNLAVNREKISDYHWVYFPEEKYLLHRISFPMNFSPSMIPTGWSSITAEISTSKHRNVPKGNAITQKVLQELKDATIILENDVVHFKSILFLKPSYVIYTHTHRSDVTKLHEFLNENAIFSCGRFGEWKYFNMDHSILSGKRVAEAIKGGS